MDEEDERWVENHRRSYLPKHQAGKKKPLPNSDAVLDCPACMTTLCLDCQRLVYGLAQKCFVKRGLNAFAEKMIL